MAEADQKSIRFATLISSNNSYNVNLSVRLPSRDIIFHTTLLHYIKYKYQAQQNICFYIGK